MTKAISTIMSRPVVTATRTESVAVAAGRMAAWRVGAVAVVEDRELVGMLGEGDVITVLAAGQTPEQVTVGSAMTEALTVGPDDTVRGVVALAIERGVRHLAVVDRGALAGVVSLRDLLAASRRIEDLDLVAALTDASTSPQRREADDPSSSDSLERRLQVLAGEPDDDPDTFLVKLDRLRRGVPHLRRPPYDVAALEPSVAVTHTWELAAEGARGPSTSVLGMISALPTVIGSVHRANEGRAPASDRPASTLAESVLHHLGASLAPFRLAALDTTLRIIATGVVDAASVSVSAGVAAGLEPRVLLPQALRVFAGPTQLGGEVTAIRAHPRSAAEVIDLHVIGDRRLPLLQGVLADLDAAAPGSSTSTIDESVPGLIATVLDRLGVPPGFEAAVLGVGRCVDWIERVEAARLRLEPTRHGSSNPAELV